MEDLKGTLILSYPSLPYHILITQGIWADIERSTLPSSTKDQFNLQHSTYTQCPPSAVSVVDFISHLPLPLPIFPNLPPTTFHHRPFFPFPFPPSLSPPSPSPSKSILNLLTVPASLPFPSSSLWNPTLHNFLRKNLGVIRRISPRTPVRERSILAYSRRRVEGRVQSMLEAGMWFV